MAIAMDENLFPTLPLEMMFDILSRLPLGTITRCKSVCKPWRDLIEGFEFATSHFSKSRSGLVLLNDVESSKPYRICAFADDDHGCPTVVADFGFPQPTHDCSGPFVSHNTFMKIIPHSSVNGFLLLVDGVSESRNNVIICNPITREYIEVPPPPPPSHPLRRNITSCRHLSINQHRITYGFGASKISGQYKVVRISLAYDHRPVCEVYNVRLGLWRSFSISDGTRKHVDAGFFFNGNLHWMACKLSNPCISCIDLETEVFTVFTAPPLCEHSRYRLCALEDRLCLCYMPDNFNSIVIWSMNKYGDEKSWGMEYMIINTPPTSSPSSICESRVVPLKVFKETGDILFKEEDNERLFLYSNKAKTIREYGLRDVCNYYSTHFVVYTPSFFSLRTMGIQNVASF